MFTFSVFDRKFLFLIGNPGDLVQKFKVVSSSLNFAQDQYEHAELCRKYVVFNFSVLDQKNPFWANLVK